MTQRPKSTMERWEAGVDAFAASPRQFLFGSRYQPLPPGNYPPVLTRVYPGKQQNVMALFQKDAAHMATGGYYPISQMYVPGSWSAGAYVFGVLMILLFGFGLLILGYLLIVKPAGTLTVTYQRN